MEIAAVVITHNRLILLKECIGALRKQTKRVDELIVINNASSDGTEEWAKKQNDLTLITQENLGGAGGFYTGIKTAFEKGYDWIWCMDDDGKPDKNCLTEILKYTDQNKVGAIGPLVISSENNEKLSFRVPFDLDNYTNIGFWDKNDLINYSKKMGKEVINGWASFFNGILISKNVISKIGFPNPNLFIYGDELDYYKRIKEANYKILLSMRAKYYHPPQKVKYVDNNEEFIDYSMDWRGYCRIRNTAYLNKKECRFWGVRYVFKYLKLYLLSNM